ncbi:MAG: class I SAM-dependent methyltransferase, partial [Planctomycetes bacterium]|nr:class I SAM-dependent methyltransferase [Planctomycetota bacterium]
MRFDQDYFEGRTSYFYQFGGYRDVGSYFSRLAGWFAPHAGAGAVLDVGCAYGFLLARFDDGRPLYGCDVSEWAIRQAEARLPRGRFQVIGAADPLPYEDGRFDSVLCTDVLEHLVPARQDAMLAEVARVLAPGGRFFMTTPNLGLLRRWVYGRADRAEEHIAMRPLRAWKAELARHGFETLDSWTYLNGFLPGRLWVGWLPECAIVARKAAGA